MSLPTATWTIVEYHGHTGLERLEDDWRRLYAASPSRSSYHAYEAHRAYAELLCDAPEKLRYLALTDGCQVRAICVLEAKLERTLGVPIPVWRVTYQPHSPLGDVICPEDEARRTVVPALIRYLRHHAGGRHLLILGPLPKDSALWDGLDRLHPSEYCVEQPMSSFVFDCTKPFEDHVAGWSRSFRRDLRRHRQKLKALGEVRYVSRSEEPALGEAFQEFLDVEASGWKGEAGTRSAIRFRGRQPGFFGALASLNHDGDHCEINALYADGRCLASQFCMLTGREYGLHKSGYEEAFSRLSPGQLLIEQTLKRCCEDTAIDRFSLVSDSAWQRSWHPDSLPLSQGYFAIGRWSGRPLIALLRFRFGHARRFVRRVRSQRASLEQKRTQASSRPAPQGHGSGAGASVKSPSAK